MLKLYYQRIVLAPIYFSLGEKRIHGVDDGLSCLFDAGFDVQIEQIRQIR